jgi:cyclic pyranopterin phosphate synthase
VNHVVDGHGRAPAKLDAVDAVDGVDDLSLMRAGADDAELERIRREAVWPKRLKHGSNDPGFRQPARTMSRIGG